MVHPILGVANNECESQQLITVRIAAWAVIFYALLPVLRFGWVRFTVNAGDGLLFVANAILRAIALCSSQCYVTSYQINVIDHRKIVVTGKWYLQPMVKVHKKLLPRKPQDIVIKGVI